MKTSRREFITKHVRVGALFLPAYMAGISGILRAGTAPSLKVAGTARVGTLSRPGGAGTTLNTDLIAYWKLDEVGGAGTDRVDSQGANDLTATGVGITNNTGKISNAVEFSGASWLSITDNPDVSFGDEDFTWAGWVYADTWANGEGYNVLTDKWSAGNLEYILYHHVAGNHFRAALCANGSTGQTELQFTSFGAPSATTWYFIAWGHDSVNNQIWGCVNDGTVDTISHAGGCFNGTQELRFGASAGNGAQLDGRMDEWGLWGKKLSAAEITELYNSGSGKTCCPFA